MRIRKFTVILNWPNMPGVTGFGLVHASNTLGAEAYAVALYPEPLNGKAKITAIIPGWHRPERSPNSPGFAIRSYPIPLSGSHQPVPAAAATPPPFERQGQPALEDGD